MLDWSHLHTFHAVAETGSFSEAGRRLRLSQPTVSRQIAALEEALKSRLFVRRARGLAPTPAAEAILADVRRMDEAAMALGRHIVGAQEKAEGNVRVSTTEGLGVLWLIPELARFRRDHPRVTVEVVIDNQAVNLAKREADIALRLFRPQQPDLVARRLGSLGIGLYASRAYLAKRGEPKALADLAGMDIVGYDEGMTNLPQARALRALEKNGAVVMRSNNLLAIYQAVRSGLGIGFISCLTADADDRLVRLLPGEMGHMLDVWLVMHADMRRTPALRAVADFLAALVERDRGKLEGGRERLHKNAK